MTSLLDWTQSSAVGHLSGAESGFSKMAEAAVFPPSLQYVSLADAAQPGFGDVGGVSNAPTAEEDNCGNMVMDGENTRLLHL